MRSGDCVGYVDVLGVRQDVVSPVDGAVARVRGRVRPGRRVRPGASPASKQKRRRPDVQQDPDRQPRRDRRCASSAPAGKLGIASVVAYSEADRDSRAVQLADEAVCIGPAESRRSYLSAPALLSAALVSGCDAVHPGYGFLSEDDTFAEMTRAHGLTFIGPPPEVLERFASKAGTRTLLGRHGLPTIPGSRHAARRRSGACRSGSDRLPGADQAVGRRRWQGHAHGALARGSFSRP